MKNIFKDLISDEVVPSRRCVGPGEKVSETGTSGREVSSKAHSRPPTPVVRGRDSRRRTHGQGSPGPSGTRSPCGPIVEELPRTSARSLGRRDLRTGFDSLVLVAGEEHLQSTYRSFLRSLKKYETPSKVVGVPRTLDLRSAVQFPTPHERSTGPRPRPDVHPVGETGVRSRPRRSGVVLFYFTGLSPDPDERVSPLSKLRHGDPVPSVPVSCH